MRPKELPFAAAFVSCSLDPLIESAKYSQHANQYFITDIKLIRADSEICDACDEEFRLNDIYSLLISRDPAINPIIDAGNFEQVPEGWESAKVD